MSETEKLKKAPNQYFIYLAIFLSALGFIYGIISRDPLALLILIPSTIYLHRNKAKTKKEENARDNVTIASYSFILLLPVCFILVLLSYLFLTRVFPNILNSF